MIDEMEYQSGCLLPIDCFVVFELNGLLFGDSDFFNEVYDFLQVLLRL
jgi:hypothetical protein